jgi:CheY-like chemotaxis protein
MNRSGRSEPRTFPSSCQPNDTGDREQRLQALGMVTGELLHDLGGILAILGGRVALAREASERSRVPSEELSLIQADVDELRRMVIDILAEIRGARPSPEVTFPVTGTIEEVVTRWLAGAPSVHTTFRSSLKREVEVAGPRSFFARAVGNLLRNAARHARRELRLSVDSLSPEDRVSVRIEDDGPGIAPELRARLFEPFVSRSEFGTGLGLSFARWGIERLGGTLSVDPSPSSLGGAAFVVELPVAMRGSRSGITHQDFPAVPSPARRPSPLDGIRVAIVDDEEAIRRTFARLLRRAGAEVLELDPARWNVPDHAVIELAELAPQAILLDLNLLGLSGLDIHRGIHRVDPRLAERVLLFTGGTPPPRAFDHCTLNKMIGWDELVVRILRVAGPSKDRG